MNKKSAFAIILGGSLVILLFVWQWTTRTQGEVVDLDFGDEVIYTYEISSHGGMGEELSVSSKISGKLALEWRSASEVVLIPFETVAELKVSGTDHRELMKSMIPAFEQPAVVFLNEFGLPTGFELHLKGLPYQVVELVVNQYRSVLNTFFLPRIRDRQVFEGQCLMGRCTYTQNVATLRGQVFEYNYRREHHDEMPLVGELSARFYQDVLKRLSGTESLSQDQGDPLGMQSDTTWEYRRIAGTRPKSQNIEGGLAQRYDFSLSSMTQEARLAQARAELEGISIADLINRARALDGAELAAFGTLYTLFKSKLLIDPDAAMELALELIQREDQDAFYITAINALGEDGSPESQRALLKLIEHFDQLGNDFEVRSLMLSLSYAEVPLEEALDLVREAAQWSEPLVTPRQESARLISGNMARQLNRLGDKQKALDMLGLPSGGSELDTLRGRELTFQLEAIGNSGHADLAERLYGMLERAADLELKETLLLALRFVPEEQAFEVIQTYLSDSSEQVVSAARRALQLRCEYCSECERACQK
jgi:hypothetical protein